MKESQIKRKKSNVKQIPFDSNYMKKNKTQISNNKKEKNNLKNVNKYLINNDKKLVTKNNSNYKLSGNIKNEYSFIKNLRNKYNKPSFNSIKNLSHNEIFLNKSVNDSKPKTSIHRINKNKNYSLNKTNISSVDKKSTQKLKKIPSTLEKKINSYLIPKPITTELNKNQIMKFINVDKMTNKNNHNQLKESKPKQNQFIESILSEYHEQNNLQRLNDNSLNTTDKRKSNQKIRRPLTNINNKNGNKINELNLKSDSNFIEGNKDNPKILYKQFSDINHHLKENHIKEKNDKIIAINKFLLQNTKSENNFIQNKNIITNGKTPILKKNENLINKSEKEEEYDKDIRKKVSNIIENLKNERKKGINKFININVQIPKEILNIEEKGKNEEDNTMKNNDNYNEIIYLNNIKPYDKTKVIENNEIESDLFNNGIDSKNYEKKSLNKDSNYLKANKKQINENNEDNQTTKEIKSPNIENKSIYPLNYYKDFNNNNKDNNNNNSNILDQINSKIFSQKRSINNRNFVLFNNRFQKNDIIKIDVENLKNKYSVKKDLEKISENQNIPELITNSLTGLVNLGETCYMNTGLQNLIHCVPFINELFSSINDFKDKLEEKPITNSFYNLSLSLIKYDNYNLKFNFNSYNPILFKKNFCRSHKQYSDNEQHDSLEFLRILLDDISKELNQTKVISKYKEISTEGKSKEQQNKEYNDFYLCRENSIVVKIFYSQIMNEFICECGDISYSFEKILDIPLLFPKEINEKEINLNDLISNYFEGEDITWNLVCQKCSKKDLKRNKKIKMTILPNVLIFSLQRFNPITGVKINKYINYNEIIDLKSFCDNDFFNGKLKASYKLFGISNHSGTINFGHYYSYTKVGNNWFEFNDSCVKLINLHFCSKAAYFFFYEKID